MEFGKIAAYVKALAMWAEFMASFARLPMRMLGVRHYVSMLISCRLVLR